MNIEDCEGCHTEHDECLWFSKNLICPCSTCLVKVMCTNSCELLDNHIGLIKEPKILVMKDII